MEVMRRVAAAEAAAFQRYGTGRQFGPLWGVVAAPGLPLNAAWHDGSRPFATADLRAYLTFAQAWGVEAWVHVLSAFAPGVLPALQEADFALHHVLHLYTHDLEARPAAPPLEVVPSADPAGWAALSARGFGSGSEAVMRAVAQAPGTHLFTAQVDGRPAGTAALSLTDGVAAFHGTSTLAEFRERGVQAALLAARLHAAHEDGAKVATVFVTPDTGSERNVIRAGFRLSGARLSFTPR
ncbi:hypothetical protein GCM10017782_27800 [Deinococcus ficus]|nr:hypothetical protein GCM10017782_27800 [Deinococcus ficus]